MNDIPTTDNFARLISASLLRLRLRSPFFATLAMFARFIPSDNIPTAATDGKDVYVNPVFLNSLPSQQQDGLILHEVLHAALLHPSRLGVRDLQLWNIAADIVVNGTIAEIAGVELPPESLRDRELEKFSVEEVYELLQQRRDKSLRLARPDLLCGGGAGWEQRDAIAGQGDLEDSHCQENNESYWRNALQQAVAIARTTQAGNLPTAIAREVGEVVAPQLDWKSYLWRYLVQTPTDFQGFDRRLIGSGLYLETLMGESVRVFVGVDTSGSISEAEFQLFLGEIDGIIASYPHLEGELYYVNTEVRGPYPLNPNCSLPAAVGGGGTSFTPFFDTIRDREDGQTTALSIYLTDGYGKFPPFPPALPTLWVVTPGGLDLSLFPFGEAVRLIS
jgi:predicted metal-dependent peptidase